MAGAGPHRGAVIELGGALHDHRRAASSLPAPRPAHPRATGHVNPHGLAARDLEQVIAALAPQHRIMRHDPARQLAHRDVGAKQLAGHSLPGRHADIDVHQPGLCIHHAIHAQDPAVERRLPVHRMQRCTGWPGRTPGEQRGLDARPSPPAASSRVSVSSGAPAVTRSPWATLTVFTTAVERGGHLRLRAGPRPAVSARTASPGHRRQPCPPAPAGRASRALGEQCRHVRAFAARQRQRRHRLR